MPRSIVEYEQLMARTLEASNRLMDSGNENAALDLFQQYREMYRKWKWMISVIKEDTKETGG